MVINSKLSKDAQSNMSDIIWSLNESEASTKQLIEKVQDFVDDTLLPLKIPFELKVDSSIDMQQKLNGDFRHQLLMVCKEAISNAIKHTYPEKITLIFNAIQGEYEVSIINWFQQRKTPEISTGHGLNNIKNRIQSLNGRVNFQETANSFTLNIHLP